MPRARWRIGGLAEAGVQGLEARGRQGHADHRLRTALDKQLGRAPFLGGGSSPTAFGCRPETRRNGVPFPAISLWISSAKQLRLEVNECPFHALRHTKVNKV